MNRSLAQINYDATILDRFCDEYFTMKQFRTNVGPRQVEIKLFLTNQELNGDEYYENLLAIFTFDCWGMAYCIQKPDMDFLKIYVTKVNRL